jgi:hypothetical protein
MARTLLWRTGTARAARHRRGRQGSQRSLIPIPTTDPPGDPQKISNRYTEELRWEILLLEPVSDWFLGLAIILVAGDKAGRWSGWYAEAIPLAEERYAVYWTIKVA